MSFTFGRINGKPALVAACDFCPAQVAAERDEGGECQVPAGWIRIGERQHVCDIFCVPIYRSTLACPDCQANFQDLASGEGAGDAEVPPLGRLGLIREVGAVSSGTLATLTGFSRYDQLDSVRALWIEWCQHLPAARLARIFTWQEAWAYFWDEVTCGNNTAKTT